MVRAPLVRLAIDAELYIDSADVHSIILNKLNGQTI